MFVVMDIVKALKLQAPAHLIAQAIQPVQTTALMPAVETLPATTVLVLAAVSLIQMAVQ